MTAARRKEELGALLDRRGARVVYAPAIRIVKPTPNQQFVDKLDLSAAATDTGVGLARITFSFDGANDIRNFTDGLTNDTPVGLAGFTPTGRQPQVVPALGPTMDVGLCDTCKAIDPHPAANQTTCPNCGATVRTSDATLQLRCTACHKVIDVRERELILAQE